jgi:antiviral helicase SKI2
MTNYLISKDLTPAVFFVFSLKKIDEYSKFLSSNDFATKEESSKIISFFDKCVALLGPKDRNLNQIRVVRSILLKGIGIHHAGLIPILKEIIEILYSKGLIKILFATTSFAIGLNMPTRTVIFTEIEKFNEEQKIMLTSVYIY